MATVGQTKQEELGMDTAVSHKWFLLILGLYLAIATGYSITTPLFEAPDEHHHFFNAVAIQQSGQLPRSDQNPGLARQEAAQPPLYYLLAALLILPIDVDDAADMLWPNPYVQLGNANSPDNANAFIHTEAEGFPWRGAVLAGHMMRFLSVLLGAGTLVFLFYSARLIWPNAPQNGLLATSLVAFLPQFGFLHGSISNDPLMIFVATAVLYQLLFLWVRQVTNGRLVLLGVTLGVGLLAKTTGLLLLVWTVGWLVLISSYQKKKLDWQTAVWVVLPALLIGGWWLVRNWLLYEDITAANQFIALAGGNRHYTLGQVFGELDRVWLSAIGFFGWMTVRSPIWVQWLWAGIIGAAAAGGLWQLRRRTHRRRTHRLRTHRLRTHRRQEVCLLVAILGSWFALVLFGWLQFSRQTSADQGRLLFPALTAVVLLITMGFAQWRWRHVGSVVSGIALLTTLYSLFFVLPAAYAIPQPYAALPTLDTLHTTMVDRDLGQGVVLIAAQANTHAAHPGDFVELTLFWRVTTIPDEPPTLVLELFGREYASVGKLLSYHGNGRFPANLWQPEGIYQDKFWVQLAPDMATPTLVRPMVHLLNEATSVTLTPIKVTAPSQPELETAVASLGGGIDLIEVGSLPETAVAGEQIDVQLTWQARMPVQQSLTTFVHLGGQTEQPLAQGDNQPLNGDYPTQYWDANERITDAYTLALPTDIAPGEYPLYIGLYDAAAGVRLPVLVDGQIQPFSAYRVGLITVLPTE